MLRAFVGLSLLVVFVAPVRAGDPPKALPPRVMVAEVDKDGRAFLPAYVTVYRQEKVTYKVVVNGRAEDREKIVKVPEIQQKQVKVHLDDAGVEVYGTDGKRVDVKGLKFRGPVGVFVSSDGRPVDPYYLRVIRPGTLIVVSRALVETGYTMPPPAPEGGKQPE